MAYQTTEQIAQQIKNISADLKRYVEKRIELLAVTAGDHYSRMLANSIQKTAGLLILGVAVIFLLIALAIFLGSLLGSASLGYVVVALPLLICGYMIFMLKPEGLNQKLKNEIGEDLVYFLNSYDEAKQDELTSFESPERLKEPDEYDGRK